MTVFSSTLSWAGIVELGVSGSYKKSNINDENYKVEDSLSGTISYYYGEMSAIELSYTKGTERNTYTVTGSTSTLSTYSTIMGLDLVFSFAGREASFQPFVKAGIAQLKKEVYFKSQNLPEEKLPGFEGTVPSAGIGFRLRITKSTSFKVGVDAWTVKNKNNDNTSSNELDHAARLGLSWMF